MDRHARLLGVALLGAVVVCGGCGLFKPRPVKMDLEGFHVENVTFPEGAYRSDAAGGYVALARWRFQNFRGMASMDQTATWRYLLRLRLDAGADGKPAVRDAVFVIASFDAGDLMTASDVQAALALDETRHLSGTVSGTWQWTRGTHVAGPLNCPRSGAFSATLEQMPFDPAVAGALADDLGRHEAWIRGGPAPTSRPVEAPAP